MTPEHCVLVKIENLFRAVAWYRSWKGHFPPPPSLPFFFPFIDFFRLKTRHLKEERRGQIFTDRVAPKISKVQIIPRRVQSVASKGSSRTLSLCNNRTVIGLYRHLLRLKHTVLPHFLEGASLGVRRVGSHVGLGGIGCVSLAFQDEQRAAADDFCSDLLNLVPAITAKIIDRKSTRLNSSHTVISYAVFCLKKKKKFNLAEVHQRDNVAH